MNKMSTTDQIRKQFTDTLNDMVEMKRTLMKIDKDCDGIHDDLYDSSVRDVYMYDSCYALKEAMIHLTDAIIYIKHEISVLGDKDD